MIACAGIVPSFCGVALEDLSCLGLERKLFPRCRCVLVLRGKKGRAAYFFTLVSSSVRFSQAPSTNSSQETLTSRLISPRFVGSASMGRHALSLGALFCIMGFMVRFCCSVLLLSRAAVGIAIRPASANSFSNQSITFTADVPVRWNVVPHKARRPLHPRQRLRSFDAPGFSSKIATAEMLTLPVRQGRPYFEVVMENLLQITIRAGAVGTSPSVAATSHASLRVLCKGARALVSS